jgi:N-acetylglucosamine kinase-like BadF-type ATPase
VSTVLGLDVGGTHSRARLVRGGALVGEATGPSASLTAAGQDSAAQAIASLLHQLELSPGAGLDAICLGTAGSGSADADAFVLELLAPLAKPGRVMVVNDARLVLATAGAANGIACVAGTGSIVVGVCGSHEERAGGWGYLLGDEGSGYWLTREAVRELARRDQSHVALGPLGDAVLKAARCPDVVSLVQSWHDRPAPALWAAMAPLVVGTSDPFAAHVVATGAAALGQAIADVHQRLVQRVRDDEGNSTGGTLQQLATVVLAGGLLTGCAAMAQATALSVKKAVPTSDARVITGPPVAGAVKLAQALAYQPVDAGQQAPAQSPRRLT